MKERQDLQVRSWYDSAKATVYRSSKRDRSNRHGPVRVIRSRNAAEKREGQSMEFDQNALEAVQQYHFDPARLVFIP